MLLETTKKFALPTEQDAKEMIESFRADAESHGYKVKKAGYEYKSKKAKGEIVGEKWIVTVVQTYAEIWDDIE